MEFKNLKTHQELIVYSRGIPAIIMPKIHKVYKIMFLNWVHLKKNWENLVQLKSTEFHLKIIRKINNWQINNKHNLVKCLTWDLMIKTFCLSQVEKHWVQMNHGRQKIKIKILLKNNMSWVNKRFMENSIFSRILKNVQLKAAASSQIELQRICLYKKKHL